MTVVTAGRKRFFVMANTVAQAASEARYRSDIRYRIVLVPLRTPPARAKHDTPRTKPSLCAFQSGHALMHCTCPLSRGKQTSQLTVPPKRIPPFRRDRRASILQIAALAPKPFSASAAYFIHEVSHQVQPRVEVLFCLILRDPITLLDYSL